MNDLRFKTNKKPMLELIYILPIYSIRGKFTIRIPKYNINNPVGSVHPDVKNSHAVSTPMEKNRRLSSITATSTISDIQICMNKLCTEWSCPVVSRALSHATRPSRRVASLASLWAPKRETLGRLGGVKWRETLEKCSKLCGLYRGLATGHSRRDVTFD